MPSVRSLKIVLLRDGSSAGFNFWGAELEKARPRLDFSIHYPGNCHCLYTIYPHIVSIPGFTNEIVEY